MALHTTTWGAPLCPHCGAEVPVNENPYSGMAWEGSCVRCERPLMLRVVELYMVRPMERGAAPILMTETGRRYTPTGDGETRDLYSWRGAYAVGAALGFHDDWKRWEGK